MTKRNLLHAAGILGFFAGSLMGSDPGTWSWKDPSPQGAMIQASARSEVLNRTVAVGRFGLVYQRDGVGAWQVGTRAPVTGVRSLVWVDATELFFLLSRDGELWKSADGLAWTFLTRRPGASSLVVGANQLVTMEGTGVGIGNLSGESWSSVRIPGLAAGWQELGFAGGTYLVRSTTGVVFTSPNARAWTKRVGLPKNVDYFDLASAGGRFLSFGIERGTWTQRVFVSSTGIDWTEVTIGDPSNQVNWFESLRSDGEAFWMSSSNAVFYSTDGETWTSLSASSPLGAFSSVVRNGTKVTLFTFERSIFEWDGTSVAEIGSRQLWPNEISAAITTAGVGSAYFASDSIQFQNVLSADGITFALPDSDQIQSRIRAVAKLDGRFVGYDPIGDLKDPSQAPGFYESPDGTAWTRMGGTPAPEAKLPRDVVSFAANADESAMVALVVRRNYLAAVGREVLSREIYRSTDWTNWQRILPPGAPLSNGGNSGLRESVSWDGSNFIVLAAGAVFLGEADAVGWRRLPALPTDSATLLRAFYPRSAPAANLAAAVASNGNRIVVRSTKIDPVNGWVFRTDFNRFWVFEDGVWIERQTRSNAFARTQYESPYQANSSDLAWNGATFIAVSKGYVSTSPDGLEWTDRFLGADGVSATWTGTQFVVLDSEYGLLTHPTGLSEVLQKDNSRLDSYVARRSGAAGSYQIAMQTEGSWRVTEAPAWAKVTPASGTGNATLTVTYQANTTRYARSGRIQVAGSSHVILQAAGLAAPPIAAPGLGGLVTVPLSGPWFAIPQSDWISVAGDGTGTGPMRVTFSPNRTSNPRTGTVIVNGESVTFVQAAQSIAASKSGTFSGGIFQPTELSSLDPATGSVMSSIGVPSGAVQLTLTTAGKYTGSVRLGALVFNGLGDVDLVAGTISGEWTSTTRPVRKLAVQLSIVQQPGFWYIAGTAEEENVAQYKVLAGAQVFSSVTNPYPYLGRQTWSFRLQTVNSPASGFNGNGYAAVGFDKAGVAKLAGKLADGSPLTASLPVWGATGTPGESIVFVTPAIASTRGSLSLVASAWGSEPLNGAGRWEVPADPRGVFPDGIDADVELEGASYLPPAARLPVVQFNFGDQGVVGFDDGSFGSGSLDIVLGRGNTVLSDTGKNLGRINPATGVFTLRFVNPNTGQAVAAEGVINQEMREGKGFFVSQGRSTWVRIGAP